MSKSKAVFLLFFLLSSCATPPIAQKTFYAPAPEPIAPERQDFKEIQLLFNSGLYEDALRKILIYESRYDSLKHKEKNDFALIFNLKGLIYFLSKKYSPAIVEFKKSIQLQDQPNFQVYVLYNLASAQFEAGLLPEAKATFAQINSALLNPANQSKYIQLKAKLENLKKTPPEPHSVGVLLPFKGKYSKFAEQCLHGIELAFRIYNINEPDTGIRLILEDSGETPEKALEGLNKLYEDHHVIAVLGPLLSRGIEKITQRAEELELPLLYLAQQTGVSGKFLFQSAVPPKTQAYEIARFAIRDQGLKKFAILQPQDKFGELFANSFWDSVEELGGEIVGIETYPSGETDFRQYIDKLSGLYYLDARQKELEDLARIREDLKIKKKNRKTEQYFNLKPIVDYEAVFIPDEPTLLGQILPMFAYRDIDKVKFLGVSTWNSPELVSRAQNFAENSFFVDVFNNPSQSPKAIEFIEKFKLTFEQEPSPIEALSYDAALILETLMSRYSIQDRPYLVEKLRSVSNFQGVTGLISYQDGKLKRNLTVLTVKKGKIVEAFSP